jgi:hypothetical protein
LQRLRSLLSDLENVAIPSLAQKTFDAEKEALEHALTKSFRIRNDAIKSLAPRDAAFGTQPTKKSVNAILRTLFKRCGKLWIGRRI